jgi:outer membrane cobalamin receptor
MQITGSNSGVETMFDLNTDFGPMRRLLRWLAVGGLVPLTSLIFLLSAATHAQESTAAAEDEAEDSSSAVDEIVITGSRIARRDYDSPSPIMTVGQEQIQASGAIALNNALGDLPQFRATGEGGQGTGGRALVNLRGLGSSRNLVLLDGRRLPISSAFGEVDTSILPSTIVSSVETITGGASAVYGSDAMSGVVNFISERNFEGVRADIQYGNSAENDFGQSTASLMMGGEFAAGRGNTYVAVSVTDRDNLPGRNRFKFYQYGVPSSYIGMGTFVPSAANLPDQDVVNTLFTGYGIAPGDLPPRNDRFGFNDDGSLFSQNFGAQNYQGAPYEWIDGYAYAVINGQNVRMPVSVQGNARNSLEQKNLFTKSEYEITDNITGYFQALVTYSRVNTNSGGTLTQFGNPVIPVTNPFIPADLATLLASRPNPNANFDYNSRYVAFSGKNWDEDYYSQQFIFGLKGDFNFKDWSYDAYYAWDKVRHGQTQNKAVFLSRVNNLVQAADGGASICAGGYNPFGLQNVLATSQECLDYIGGTTTSNEDVDRTTFEASIQGSLFDLPAGPVQFAFLASTRKDEYDYNPDKALQEQDVQAVVASAPIAGSIEVKELGVEFAVPVLDSLTLNLAARYSDYDLSGGTSTSKIDALWRPTETLLFRGGYQRAIRAPNIGELFSPETGDQVGFGSPPNGGEPCDIRTNARMNGGTQLRQLCIDTGVPANVVDTYIFPTTASFGVFSGNLDLEPESADTFTLGVVWTPNFGNNNLSLSLDYFDIDITEVIDTIDGSVSLDKCYNLDGSNPNYNPNNSYCQLIDRGPTGEFDVIRQPFFNLGNLATSGIDLAVNWAYDLNSGATLSVNSLLSFVSSYDVVTLPGEAAIDYKGTIGGPGGPKPDFQTLTTFGYSKGPLSADLRWYYLPAMDSSARATNPNSTARGVKAYSKLNLVGTYDLSDTIDLRAGITNLLDTDIPQVGNSLGSTDSATYDIIGRSYYVGLRWEF